MQVDELKNMVKQLHKNGIEVMLDVVFNHTAEGNEQGPYISYRGIDNKTYYMLTPEGYYYNFSGCGNTLNCNNPNVRDMIVESLRYWVTDYHIDGFRFDLAAILGRDQNGHPMSNPPLLESLAHDPILGKTKLIAEAWDAGGLYQVGSFPSWGRWAEWNGRFRDSMRRFLKSDEQVLSDVKERIIGSPDLYASQGRGIKASVNFITAHDGFTMMDLVSYNSKHNEANGEDNCDGENHNNSWNCGCEGETDDPEINSLRHRQVKNAITMLMMSQGIPMVLSGDEMGNSQQGNNNAYCQDNEMAWLDWNNLEKNADIFRYFKQIIKFRRQHKVLRYEDHLRHQDYQGLGYPDFSWHGVKAWQPESGYNNLTVAFMLNGQYAPTDGVPDDFIYVAMNMHWEMHGFEPPQLPDGMAWHVFANTGMPSPDDIFEPDKEPLTENQHEVLVGPRSIIILVGRGEK
jgi:glycogen operon protein